tara:strand:+ start:1178 stop:2392 length:1215 start_codon:yes stop_codon:yes gene_type:complete
MIETLANKKILLIISGGISAYKTLDLIRNLRKRGAEIKTVLTKGGKKFVTSLSIASLTNNTIYENIFDSKNESEMDHISLSRWSDLILVAPATANIIAKLAQGRSDDLASTIILASNKQIILVPAMNVRMWIHPATKKNINILHNYGYLTIGPDTGEMACGEFGEGKMTSPEEIYKYLKEYLDKKNILKGKKLNALVTAGPTRDYLDPIRYLTNGSSGKQGYEIARSLSNYGIKTTLISGPSDLIPPKSVKLVKIKTAEEMLNATKKALPVDIAICAAAVSDFSPVKYQKTKIKKTDDNFLSIKFKKNPDILEYLSKNNSQRPKLVVGFSADVENNMNFAKEKMSKKHCDWLIVNDVSNSEIGFNSDNNAISIIYSNNKIEKIPKNSKKFIADKISKKIINNFL